MKNKKGKIHIGTSGWHYKHWRGTFYPVDLKPPDFMNYYLNHFDTVEINNSFYRLPTPETFITWRQAVPENFIFAVKASRYITHNKKLIESKEALHQLMHNVSGLQKKEGVILFQLPPGWKCNVDRLREFVASLDPSHRYTFEFRNQTWYNDEVYDVLKNKNIAFCIYELDHHMSPVVTTADYVYVRLHGPEGKYTGSYSDKTLEMWAKRCADWSADKKDVYIYFDNDQMGYAAFNAKTLQNMLKVVIK